MQSARIEVVYLIHHVSGWITNDTTGAGGRFAPLALVGLCAYLRSAELTEFVPVGASRRRHQCWKSNIAVAYAWHLYNYAWQSRLYGTVVRAGCALYSAILGDHAGGKCSFSYLCHTTTVRLVRCRCTAIHSAPLAHDVRLTSCAERGNYRHDRKHSKRINASLRSAMCRGDMLLYDNACVTLLKYTPLCYTWRSQGCNLHVMCRTAAKCEPAVYFLAQFISGFLRVVVVLCATCVNSVLQTTAQW